MRRKDTARKGYPVPELCVFTGATRSAYYRWLKNPASISEMKNEELATMSRRYTRSILAWAIGGLGMN